MIELGSGIDATIAFGISFGASALILASREKHLPLSDRRLDMNAIQAAHQVPTPRIGGLALLLGVLPMAFLVPQELAPRIWLFLVSLIPVFVAGLAEDLGWHVRPRTRLLAAAISSAVVIALLGVWLPRTDFPPLDYLMAFAPFAIAFTIFAGAGICNGFNLIDGVNGLSASVGIMAALSLAAIAAQSGDAAMIDLNMIVIGALLGFLVFNFPLGKIFLGDAGAYGLGHILAWFAIALLVRLDDLTPWAVILIFFWPVADTFLAIYRRRRSGRPTDQPDRLHFHQLVMRAIEITLMGRKARRLSNPLATLVIAPMFVFPALTGVLLWNKPTGAALAVGFYSVLFMLTYSLGLRFAQSNRRRLFAQLLTRAPEPRPMACLAERDGDAGAHAAAGIGDIPLQKRPMELRRTLAQQPVVAPSEPADAMAPLGPSISTSGASLGTPAE